MLIRRWNVGRNNCCYSLATLVRNWSVFILVVNKDDTIGLTLCELHPGFSVRYVDLTQWLIVNQAVLQRWLGYQYFECWHHVCRRSAVAEIQFRLHGRHHESMPAVCLQNSSPRPLLMGAVEPLAPNNPLMPVSGVVWWPGRAYRDGIPRWKVG